MVYFPLLQSYRGTVTLHVRASGNPDRLLVGLERAIRGVDRRLPVFNVTTLERSTRLGSLFERLAGTFAGTLGLVALALAAVGLYGVLAFSTRQRAREMAIRLAIGAQPAALTPGCPLSIIAQHLGVRSSGSPQGWGTVAAPPTGRA